MIDLGFSPALIMIVGAFLVPALPAVLRQPLCVLLPAVTLVLVWLLPDGPSVRMSFLGLDLVPVDSDRLGRLFATIFALMATVGAVFAWRQSSRMEAGAALAYAGGAIGITLAGDLVTLFVFWELMAIGSTLVVWAGGPNARAAGLRYLAIHLLGGVILMAGVAGELAATGDIALTAMQADSLSHWLILIGVLINAGAPPLSAWLPDSYPEGSFSGSVFLSAFTTKTAVFVLIRAFPGEEVLIWVGLYMVFYGLIYAFLENDLRRILAYAIVNQVGFMVTAIGIGTELALNGAAAHAFVHIIYKGLLMMTAGAVLYRTGLRSIADLGGLFRTMPFTAGCAVVGGLTTLAFPLTSGFAAKSMITLAAEDSHMALVWVLLEIGSAGAVLHAGLKFPWFTFFAKDSGLRPQEAPTSMLLAMAVFAGLCIGIGLFPAPLYALLPGPVDFWPYSWSKVMSQLQLVGFAALAFFLLLDQMKPQRTISLDWDWFYRRMGDALGKEFSMRTVAGAQNAERDLGIYLARLLERLYRHHGPKGILARTHTTGSMVMWVAILLTAYLLLGYLGVVG
ncbi:Na(+)/H(+) antiporter subunit D [Marinibaculum pumilum]|uniref:Na(+)/H(+) antiporter subunit D n=1 Tax=Marinibaculum pumilum TaxID=1766165 RepID=A0ABV7KV00_9PROT